MQVRQISIFLENRPGQLAQICRVLAEARINIAALSLADTSDFGIVRMIVDDHEKAKTVLASAGHVVHVCEVVAVCVPDQPGGMAAVMDTLDAAGVDVEYCYAFAFDGSRGKAALVFRFGESRKGAEALAAAGYTTLREQDIGDGIA